MKIALFKENQKGKTYQTENFKILYRNKGTISGDNSENVEESLYLITGKAEITLKEKTWIVEAPAELYFPTKTYHKIKAITNISLIMFEK
jgi:mannose-6-phosphate isomerase-like protein (cupin superfamily)